MSFTVTDPLSTSWVSLTAVVLSSSRFGTEYDRLKVLHEIGLSSPLPADETFYIPPQGKAIDTRVSFPDGTIINFAGQRFKDLQDEINQYADAVRAGNADLMNQINQLMLSTTMLAPVVYKAGTQILTFEYELALYPNSENAFDISLWAPMPSFTVQAGGQVTGIIQLPSEASQAFRANVIEAKGYLPDGQGNPSQEIAPVFDQSCGLRRIIAWSWQNDPLFRVRYQYS